MEKIVEIPEGYEARIEDNKVILEPKESEDERIRSFLYEFIKVCGWSEKQYPPREKCLAYLEKQKEQKPVQDNDEREYVRTIKSLISDFLRDKDEIDREYYQQIYDWLDGRHIEQIPAKWSEEDEDMYARVVRRYTDYEGVILRTKEKSVAAKMLDAMAQEEIWLNSLRLKFHWKPGEDQIQALYNILEATKKAGSISDRASIVGLIHDLKKLM